MKIALMISFNTKTDEILFTKFVGDGCMDKAVDWAVYNLLIKIVQVRTVGKRRYELTRNAANIFVR